jgi:hypothetical protein
MTSPLASPLLGGEGKTGIILDEYDEEINFTDVVVIVLLFYICRGQGDKNH